MAQMRLQKYLSASGVCSRRRGEQYILEGRLTVDGRVVTALGTKIDPALNRVEFDGRPIGLQRVLIYLALNKPPGVVTSCRQPGERTVLDLIPLPERIYPVGRLDKDSTGLLLLTNDGRLHHRLSHPSFDHEKEYDVCLVQPIPDGALRRMAQGLPLMGTRTRPAEVTRLTARRFRMVLKEGRNRQIRRMVSKVGSRVASLKRIRVANIRLGNLAEGAWRHLTAPEIESLVGRQESRLR